MAKAPADIRSLARAQTTLAIRTLTGVCGSGAAPAAPGCRLLGPRAPQPHTGEDRKKICVTIRQMITEGDACAALSESDATTNLRYPNLDRYKSSRRRKKTCICLQCSSLAAYYFADRAIGRC